MSIGILGAGAIGSNLARLFARNGISATIANSRGPDSLADLVGEFGPSIRAATAQDAARADIVFVAVRWADLDKALGGLPAWNGRIVVDATNPVIFLDTDSPDRTDPANPLAAYGIKAIDLGGRHSTQVFARHVPGARVVKAFNHIDARILATTASGGRRVAFLSSDDADARTAVREIIEKTGYYPVDLGGLDVGGPLASLPFGSLATLNLVNA